MRICVCCALRLADAAPRAVWWERRGFLGRLVRLENSQAVEELLAEIAREQRPDAGLTSHRALSRLSARGLPGQSRAGSWEAA